MKAIQITQPGEIKVINIPEPVIKPDEALIKIRYVGFCGSDLNTYSGKNALAKKPVIPGHETGGLIEAVGEKVPTHLAPGLSCTVNPYTACGCCPSCRNGRTNACQFNQTLGVQRDGAMCEYIAVPWNKIITDENITPYDFCLVEPMSVGFHAVERGKVTNLDTVMVLGCGMIGIGALVSAVQRGAIVIAVDVDDNKLVLAKRLGAMFTINSQTENVHERLLTITNNSSPDVVIEAVGITATYQMAVQEVAFTGRVVCIGYAKSDISFETKLFVQKELDIRGSRNALPDDFKAVMDWVKKGAYLTPVPSPKERGESTFPKEEFINGVYPPEKAQEALERWKANQSKIFRLLVEF